MGYREFDKVKGSPHGGTNVGKLNYRHGMHNTSIYRRWASMKCRCHNPNHHKYADYGGRGIRVCDRWHDFVLFMQDMPAQPTSKHELDRIDNDKGYEPGNVRWVTRKRQLRNTRQCRFLTCDGVTLTTTEWAERLGVSKHSLASRLKLGWSDERALTTPFRRKSPLPL